MKHLVYIALCACTILIFAACMRQVYLVERDENGQIRWSTLHPINATELDTLERLTQTKITFDQEVLYYHKPQLLSKANNYNATDYNTFAVYTAPHTVENPHSDIESERMAIWCTREATYLASITLQRWTEQYFHTGSKKHLRNSATGECYYIRNNGGYPLDSVYWIRSIAGQWVCHLQEYPPLPPGCTTIDIINEDTKLKDIEGTTGWATRKNMYNINVAAQQMNQSKMSFKETIIVK